MKLPTLFSRASTGALREWTIECNDNAYRTHSGVVGGKITTSEWYTVEATNVGRANEKNIAAQAEFNARQTWKKKIETGYFENADSVDSDVGYVEPMLAKKWEDRKDDVDFPVFSQPKLDGLRCLITSKGIATSRNGKEWKTIPHVHAALKEMFENYPALVLDGELYNHEFHADFNKITSLAKKTKPTREDLKEAEDKLQFHWYDIVDTTMEFSRRSNLIALIYKRFFQQDSGGDHPSIKKVMTTLHSDEKSLTTAYERYMQDGFEGQMVRLDGVYENKRSVSLLKRKEFSDAEYKIVDICEGNGNKVGMAGYMILAREDGVTFHSNIKGTFEFLEELLKGKDKLIGTFATCTYFNLTPDGIPRFPYVTKLRAGNGID